MRRMMMMMMLLLLMASKANTVSNVFCKLLDTEKQGSPSLHKQKAPCQGIFYKHTIRQDFWQTHHENGFLDTQVSLAPTQYPCQSVGPLVILLNF